MPRSNSSKCSVGHPCNEYICTYIKMLMNIRIESHEPWIICGILPSGMAIDAENLQLQMNENEAK